MELVAYVFPGWEPLLRPASSRRDWMDGSPEQFAYRCLPLKMANAHGWEMLSPCGFTATWNGGMRPQDVVITCDPGTPVDAMPVALFGQATLTFHIPAILRTPPGWNLWLSGSPNAAKDGISALGGVIETDWSPYSFTMNWRFTRAHHTVRFAADEPIAFMMPVPRDSIEQFTARIAPIDDEPGLRDAFLQWSASRDAFQQRMADAPPTAPADKWQKLYYRGLNPDGTPASADHRTKVRACPFRAGDSPLDPE
ncbi:DUF6065 family protein [Novosphingobium sp.]|uniref:DUF6065 family protein n=1 Tax=Novosphingobium sp. TaxID=1874826 RepID=UPI0033425A86